MTVLNAQGILIFQISIDTPKRRLVMAKKLKATLKNDINTKMELKYLVTIPATKDHRNHVVGEVNKFDILLLDAVTFLA